MQPNYNNVYGYPPYSIQGQPQPSQMHQYPQNVGVQQPSQMQMQRQGNIQFLIVNTEEEAKGYIVYAGFKAYIFDPNHKKFYIKSTDLNGNTTYEEYSLSTPQKQEIKYATQEELNGVYQQIDNLTIMLNQLMIQRNNDYNTQNNNQNNNNSNQNQNQNSNKKGGN